MSARSAGWCFASAVFLGACGSSVVGLPQERESLRIGSSNRVLQNAPPPAALYSTSARPGGIQGGAEAERLAAELQARLRERGDGAEPDGALANAAWLLLREASAGGDMSVTRADVAARRFGFAGVVPSSGVARLDETFKDTLEQLLQSVPGNMPITRYGLVASESVHGAAVLLGNLEATLAPFPRTVGAKDAIHLQGEVAARFARASVFVTSASGRVREIALPSRHVDARIQFEGAGTYELEIMGYGKAGPAVVVNVPIYAGTAEAPPEAPRPAAAEPMDAGRAEQRLFELANAARRKAGAPELAFDPALRTVALEHSVDMVQHDFQGHVSATAGGPEDRIRRAGIRLSIVGENLGSSLSVENIHDGLLDSPAHRSTMLRPDFTHLGIGVVLKPQPGQPLFVATELFGRRPPASAARLSRAQVVDVIQRARTAAGLPNVRVDPTLSRAAQLGLAALVPDDPSTRQRAIDTAFANLQAEVNRTGRNRPASCTVLLEILEGPQLAQFGFTLKPRLSTLGIGLTFVDDPEHPRLVLLLIGEGSRGAPVECQ